jgi:hypothetical protein
MESADGITITKNNRAEEVRKTKAVDNTFEGFFSLFV